jgi:hypothetical protein
MQLQTLISRFISPTLNNSDPTAHSHPGADRAKAAAAGHIDDRLYIRSRITARFDVCWQEVPGGKKQAQARGVDMSSAGAAVLSTVPIRVGSAVYLHSKDMQLMGNATVRHCTSRKSRFLIGLEFRGPLLRSF